MFRINDVYKLHDTSFRILKMTLYHIVWIDMALLHKYVSI